MIQDFTEIVLERAFDPISLIFLGRENDENDTSMESAVAEFFFPSYMGGETWMNFREKCYPAFLDLLTDLVTEEQRLICINQWIYHSCYDNHAFNPDVTNTVNDDTMGLKDVFITVMSSIYERARDHVAIVDSEWLVSLLQQHLPALVAHLQEKFPNGQTFFTGHLNYARISSNLEYLEVILFIYSSVELMFYTTFLICILQKIDWKILQESKLYQIGQDGVREMVPVPDPADPLPVSVLGGIPIEEILLDLERFSIDPSSGGQIAIERRSCIGTNAWSVHDSTDQSLVVLPGPGEDMVARAAERRAPPRDPAREPAPIVRVPTISKYIALKTVSLSDSISQARGVSSELTTNETLNTRTVHKVGFHCNFKLD